MIHFLYPSMTKNNKDIEATTRPPLSENSGEIGIGQDVHASVLTRSSDEKKKKRLSCVPENRLLRRGWDIITWTPSRCRWDPMDPPQFSMALNLLFGFVSLFPTATCHIFVGFALFGIYQLCRSFAEQSLMAPRLQRSRWQISITAIRFSIFLPLSSGWAMSVLHWSLRWCKQVTLLVFYSCVRWVT